MTIVIQEDILDEVIFQIAPERWTMTSMTTITLGGIAGMILGSAVLYYIHKYFDCCADAREDYKESTGCKKRIKFFI